MRHVVIPHPVKRRSSVVAAAIYLVTIVPAVLAQESTLSIDRNYQFDARGDATVEVAFQFDAIQWQQWKGRYGDHPDLLLRDLNYQMAAAAISDYKLEKDEMHRSAVCRYMARGWAYYRGHGEFAVRVPKNMKLVSGSGLDWVFTSSALENGAIVNYTDHAKLPSGAHSAHVVNTGDYSQLLYSVDVSPSKPKTLLYGGVTLLAAAAGALAIASGRPGTVKSLPALQSAPQLPPPLPPL